MTIESDKPGNSRKAVSVASKARENERDEGAQAPQSILRGPVCQRIFTRPSPSQPKKRRIREERDHMGLRMVGAAHPSWPTDWPCYSPDEISDRRPIVT